MKGVKQPLTKRIYELSGAFKLGILLKSMRNSYNEKGHMRETIKYGITKNNYVCSLVYNRRTDKLRFEPPVIYQYLIEVNRNLNEDKLIDCLKEMVDICKKWINEPQYYGLHELILFEYDGTLKFIDNSKH